MTKKLEEQIKREWNKLLRDKWLPKIPLQVKFKEDKEHGDLMITLTVHSISISQSYPSHDINKEQAAKKLTEHLHGYLSGVAITEFIREKNRFKTLKAGKNFLITTHYDPLDALYHFEKKFETSIFLEKAQLGEYSGLVEKI